MTLLEYFNQFKKLIKEHPEYKNLPVVNSSDDEGNSYRLVNYGPTPAQFENLEEYYLELVYEKDESEGASIKNINAIIIN